MLPTQVFLMVSTRAMHAVRRDSSPKNQDGCQQMLKGETDPDSSHESDSSNASDLKN